MAETTSGAVEIEVGCVTATTMDQATSRLRRVLSEASDSHSGNVEVAVLSIRKGKASGDTA